MTPKNKGLAIRERALAPFIPYSCLVRPDVVKTKEGDYLAIWKLNGVPFETVDQEELVQWKEQLNTFFRAFEGGSVSFYSHLIRRSTEDRLEGKFENEFSAGLNEKYYECLRQNQIRVNEWYLSVVYRPRRSGVERKLSGAKTVEALGQEEALALRKLAEFASQVSSGLAKYGPERLSEFEEGGTRYSAPLAFLNFLLSGEWQKVRLPRAPLHEVLGTALVLVGTETVELRGVSSSRYLRLLDLKDYASETRPGILDTLLYAPLDLVLTQSFCPLPKAAGKELLQRQQRRLLSAEDGAVSQVGELSAAVDGLIAGDFALGEYHLTLGVFGETVDELREATTQAEGLLRDEGFLPALVTTALDAGFFSQLPGNWSCRPRVATLTSRNIASLSGFHNFVSGKRSGNPWGEAVTLLQTPAGPPFYFNFHEATDKKDARGEKRLGNTLVLGQSGSGKTVLLGFLLNQVQKYGATTFFFDKDRGAELAIRALGGKYLALETGTSSGLNPFQLPPSAENLAFLEQLVEVLVTQDGAALSPSDKARITAAVGTVMGFPRAIRRLGLVPQTMTQGSDPDNSVAKRLQRWVGNGPLAWVFDNEKDSLDFTTHQQYGIDGTAFLDNKVVRTPISLYLLHRMEQVIDGRRFCFFMDEFWKWLGDEAFSNFVYNKLKTIRKQNGFGVFATQSPSDVLESEISRAVVEQCATSIYLPNPRADEDEYREGFKLTGAEFGLLREIDPGSRLFLIKQGKFSTLAGLNLSGFQELDILSGSTDNISILHEILAEVGESPEKWLPIFYQRIHAQKTPSRAGGIR